MILAGLLARSGGWDEALFIVVPIGLFGGLLAIANKRAQAVEQQQEASRPDPPLGPDPSEPPPGPPGEPPS